VLNTPASSCRSIDAIFLGKAAPTYYPVTDCNDTGVVDQNAICNCQSLTSIQLDICGRDDYACFQVDRAGRYDCRSKHNTIYFISLLLFSLIYLDAFVFNRCSMCKVKRHR
jgi:hypothetical protein